jgi:hypothetical protein
MILELELKDKIMVFVDDTVDVAVALGNGIYSVGQDIVLGIERTGEGLGLGKDGRIDIIGHENNAMALLIRDVIKYGIKNRKSPLYKTILLILEDYYTYIPDKVLSDLSKKAGIGAGYMAGRMIIGKRLASEIAMKIAIAIAASATFKQIAKRMGISAAVSGTGVGAPIGLLMIQGLMQHSSRASIRLKSKSPKLYTILQRNGNLQMLYFLLEKPLKKHIEAISIAEQNATLSR